MVYKTDKNYIVVIIICVLVILGLIGYITYDKLGLGNKPKSSSLKIEKEKDYDLEKAKKLIDKYYIEREDSNSFLDGMPDEVRNIIAIRNMPYKDVKENTCLSIYKDEATAKKDESGKFTVTLKIDSTEDKIGGCDDNYVNYYGYDDINDSYNYLFGKSSNLPKSDFEYKNDLYDYVDSQNIFTQLSCRCGGVYYKYYKYLVKDAKVKGDTLTIIVPYIDMETIYKDNTAFVKTTIEDEELTYKYTDTQTDTFTKEFFEKYIDKLDRYTFTFKYEDDHYIFVSMK